ncbi:SURF1 family protein [Luteimonas sp. S4-F44]|uniref:SURF1 family protein n=1 Tax=Luteimonas sp. S4-F44 TaxID=2925842 RepID=UPI001F53AD24|nr:SURF1 family protein [Luteimonas sp. S4-F44]UNK42194.1 SURF1 family protein [Luteimonas sp. S4-F44]
MSRRSARIVGWTAAVLLALAFVGLGQWQLGRMHDKRAMLDAVEQTLTLRQAVPLAQAADPHRQRDYDWAAGRGRFLDTPAFVLDNQIHAGRPGLRVYRLFAPETGAAPLLVDLGWVPIAERTARMPSSEVLAGDGVVGPTLDLHGLLAPPPSAGLALGPAIGPGPAWLMTRFDAQAIASVAGLPTLPPRVLRLDPALPVGYGRDLEILPNTLPPEKHLGYAVQWFGLALTVLVTALVLTFRKSRR